MTPAVGDGYNFHARNYFVFGVVLGAVAEHKHEGCVTTFGYGIRLQ